MGENFENSIKLPKIFLEWAGIRIFPTKGGFVSSIKSWIFYLNFSILVGPAVLGELYWMIDGLYAGKGLEELCTCAPCFTVGVLGVAKINCLYFNRDIIRNVIGKLKSMHPMSEDLDDSNGERKILKNALKFLNRVTMSFWYPSVFAIVAFGTASMLSMVYDYYTTGDTEYKLPFRIKYVVEVTNLKRWAIIYLHQICTMLVTMSELLGSDLFFYVFCTYLEMHFGLLCLRFESVVSTSKIQTKENFREAVKRHQELIELVEQIELLYSKSTLCNIISSSLLICLSGFIVTFVDDVGAVFSFVAFLVMNLTQISLLCFVGERLSTASSRVSQAAYNSLWYDAELDIKKSVLLVITRAQEPCKLTAMKFADLNLSALSAILKTSWSYFALLKTMYD